MIWIKRFFTFLLFAVFVVPAVFRISARILESGPVEAHLPIEGRLVETTMGRIFVLEAGPVNGKPVLLAHGTAAWSGIWQESLAALAVGGYRAIAFDMPPFGYSDRAGTTESFAQWLPTLIGAAPDGLSIDPENYRNLRVPTHLIWGQEDTVTPPAQGVSLAELIPDSSLVMLENIGHIPQIENPDAFNRVLIRVIQSMKSEQAGQI